MAHDRLAQQLGADELADSLPGHGGVVGDDGEVAFLLAHDLVDQRSGVPTAMKPPIMRLAPSGIIATDCSRETVCIV